MIVSVTGLRTKGLWSYFRFWRLAVPAYRQAKVAKGNLFVQTKTVQGIQHTLTVWKDRKSLKHYILSGAHRKAMGAFAAIATGATITYESDEMPDWDSALEKWRAEAKWYEG